MKILFIGDIIGKPGRNVVKKLLPALRAEHGIDFVVANGENAAGGFGLTQSVAEELFNAGIGALTSGNHLWDKKEIEPLLPREPRILKPANYPDSAPGFPHGVYETASGQTIGVMCLQGQVFMPPIDSPFRAADRFVAELKKQTDIILVDLHAEATSEKIAMGWHLDGKISALVGTHTHVMTADERILPMGTAYITDAGMTGGFDSVIGMEKKDVLERFYTGLNTKFEVAERDVRLNAVLVEIDDRSGKARGIERINRVVY
ncbi:MAG: TIGR00282 family metallophosphoesterase [Candidatus Edwardsbacteria bacterium]|nr:TIGR00282 family metallophosphoesterase [Candidatus Edwardsbacteria bacterium]